MISAMKEKIKQGKGLKNDGGGEGYCRWLHKEGLSEEALSKVPKEVKE